MKELEKLTKEQLIIELRFLQRAYEIIVEQNKKNIQSLQQREGEWISVEDRLPEDKEWYQVSCDKGVYTIPHTYRENKGWLDYDGFESKARIKYYRLLDLTPPNK